MFNFSIGLLMSLQFVWILACKVLWSWTSYVPIGFEYTASQYHFQAGVWQTNVAMCEEMRVLKSLLVQDCVAKYSERFCHYMGHRPDLRINTPWVYIAGSIFEATEASFLKEL